MKKSGTAPSGKNVKKPVSENTQSVKSAVLELPESPITPISKSTESPSTSPSPESDGSAMTVMMESTITDTNVRPVEVSAAQLTENPAGVASQRPIELTSEPPKQPEPTATTSSITEPTSDLTPDVTLPKKSSEAAFGYRCDANDSCYVKFDPDDGRCKPCRFMKVIKPVVKKG